MMNSTRFNLSVFKKHLTFLAFIGLVPAFAPVLFAQKNLLIPLQKAGKWGYCSESKVFKILPVYEDAFPFSKTPAYLYQEADAYGRVPAMIRLDTVQFENPLALVKAASGYGYIDENGKIVVPLESPEPPQFTRISDRFLAAVRWPIAYSKESGSRLTQIAILKVNGQPVSKGFDTDFEMPETEEGYMENTGMNMFMSSSSRDSYSRRPIECEGKIRVHKNRLIWYIAENGEEIIPPVYRYISRFYKGRAIACLANEIGVCQYFIINEKNERLLPLKDVYYVEAFTEGLFRVNTKSGTGFLRLADGKYAVAPKYQGIYGFANGIAVGTLGNDIWEIIDSSGQVLFTYKGYKGFWGSKEAVFAKNAAGQWFWWPYSGAFKPLKVNPDQITNEIRIGGKVYFSFEKRNKKGLLDGTGKICLPAEYDLVTTNEFATYTNGHWDTELVGVEKNGKLGLLDDRLQVILPCAYGQINNYDKGLLRISQADKCGIVDVLQRRILLKPEYDEISRNNNLNEAFPTARFKVRLRNKWGYIDALGKIVIPILFDGPPSIGQFYEQEIILSEINNRPAIIDREGKVYTPRLQSLNYSSEGCFRVYTTNNNQNNIPLKNDGTAIWPIELRSSGVSGRCEWIIAQNTLGEFGIFDYIKRDTVLSFQYDEITYREADQVFFLTRKPNVKEIMFLESGKIYPNKQRWKRASGGVIQFSTPERHDLLRCENLSPFSDGMAGFCTACLFGFVDNQMEEVIPPVYTAALPFGSGLAGVRNETAWGFIDRKGKTIIPFEYQDAYKFVNGRAAVKKAEKWGMINTSGEVILPFRYEKIRFDERNFVWEIKDSTYMVMDTIGNWILKDCKGYWFRDEGIFNCNVNGVYTESPPSKDGRYQLYKHDIYPENKIVGELYKIEKHGRNGVIDSTGFPIVPVMFDEVRYKPATGQVFTVKQGDLYGVYSLDGKEITPVIFDKIKLQYGDFTEVIYKGRKAYFDKAGVLYDSEN